jgi:hypothetical protein
MLTVAPKPTLVAQVNANCRTQAHSGGTSRRLLSQSQVDFNSRNFKSTPVAKQLIFSDFSLILPSRSAFCFILKSTPRGTKSTNVVAI